MGLTTRGRWWLVGWATGLAVALAIGLLVLLARQRAAMADNDQAHAALFEAHPQPIVLADDGTLAIVAANRAASQTYGYSAAEFAALSLGDLGLRLPGVDNASGVQTHVAKDGSVLAVETRGATLRRDGRLLRITLITDVTDREQALSRARESGDRYRQVVETAKEGILTVDRDMTISAVNEQAAQLLGYSVDELVGRKMAELSGSGPAGTDPAGLGADLGVLELEGASGEIETTLRDKDGGVVPVLLNRSPLLDAEGRFVGQLGMITDLTEREGFEDELAFQVAHDLLTKLPNRLLLADRLRLALGRAPRGTPSVAVVFVDIDGFKDVNNQHGHTGGDRLLVELAGRLSGCVSHRDTVARFGGDQFVVISEGTGLFTERLVERLRAALAAPYPIGDTRVDVTLCMGVAVGQHDDRPGILLRNADMAKVQAKAGGPNRTEFFTDALFASSRARLELVSDLRRAVERAEFLLRFQPVVSIDDERIVGVEALIRWEHPRRGTLGPQEFIAVAEETGLIEPIGRWVIDETCRRLVGWQQLRPELTAAVNVSAHQLMAGHLDDTVRNALTGSGAKPAHLSLEITESVMMDDVEFSCRVLNALRRTGVRVAIDDFGTGYSSLAYLNRFPVDVLKIDQSFVAGLPDDDYDVALARAVLAIAETLHMSVIAEGVETAAQADALLRLGCHQAQGYHFYRPLTAEDFEALLATAADVT